MEVLQDFAAPLPVLVIAQWLGLPQQDREFIRQLSRHLLALDQESLTGIRRSTKQLPRWWSISRR
jgi:cytochrome P450